MSANPASQHIGFIPGGGEMGELIRKKNWDSNSLGPISTWPQSLLTSLSIILNSKFPMFLWWGPYLTCFYNDAYRPSLGQSGKHPFILGMSASEAWVEIWDVIKPLIDQVLNTGEATWSEDQLIPIYRNGKIEDVYWTFSYSAVTNESGTRAGVLVTCSETTTKVNTFKNLEDSNRRYFNNIMQAPVAMCVFRGRNHVVETVNRPMLELWEKTSADVINKPVFEGLPEAAGQGLEAMLDNVFITGQRLVANERPISLLRQGQLETTFINFNCEVLKEPDGTISGIIAIAADVTDQVLAREKIEKSEKEFRELANSLPSLVWTTDKEGKPTFVSKRWFQFTGLNPSDENIFKVSVHPDEFENLGKLWKSCLATGDTYQTQARLKSSQGDYQWFDVKGRAVKNEVGDIQKWIGTFSNINEQKKTEEYLTSALFKVAESEKRFRTTVQQTPIAISIFRGPEFIVETVNDKYLQLVDRQKKDFVGIPLFDSLPEAKEKIYPLLTNVLNTGVPFSATEFPVTLNRYGKRELCYFDLIYQPLVEEEFVTGIIVVAVEVTEAVIAKQLLADSEKQFRNLVLQSPVAMAICKGPKYIVEIANNIMFKNIWRKKESYVIGKELMKAFPELEQQKYPELLEKVFTTGQVHRENESIAYVEGDDGMKIFYLDFEYAPLFNSDSSIYGIIITVNDVTEKVVIRKKVEDAEERLRLATEAAELSIWDLDLKTKEIFYSARMANVFGFDPGIHLSHQQIRSYIHPDDLHTVIEKAFEVAMQTGNYKYEARAIKTDGAICWIRVQGKLFFDEHKNPEKLVGTLKDITEEKFTQQVLLESNEKFRLLADSMPQHIWTSDPGGCFNYYNQSILNYSGLSIEQMSKRNGWLQIVHPDDNEDTTRNWLHALSTGEDFLFEHRFRRYDGIYRWQLSHAIPQKDASGNIQMWVGTSTDIQDQKTFTNELELQVLERTTELEQKNKELETMNTELQSFAYVSSHDLQEPLRKIQTFATRILDKEQQNLSVNGRDYFQRMQEAAKRMQTLIEDLLSYSRTNTTERNFERTDLNKILEQVKNELKEDIEQKDAIIESSNLGYANVISFQFRQLINNLIGNALKFSKPGQPPHIQLKSEIINGNGLNVTSVLYGKMYCHLSVSDNGIGFEPQYRDRIFEVFQRLHGREEYKGTGIGLAIVKKIVENHDGTIIATGELNKGATFDIYLPEK